jgi:hypothetical protein
MDTKIIKQLEEAFGEEIALAGQDLASLEVLVKEKLQLLGQGFLQRLVDRQTNGYQQTSLACKCSGSMRFVNHRQRNIHTIFGWITIERAYYHCPDCGTTFIPYDKASGLGRERISPALAKACCMLTVDDSFEQTSRKIEAFTGQKVSTNTIERVVHHVGSVAVEQQDQQLQEFFKHKHIPEPQASPDRLYITADGTTAHETDGWHEAKVGCIYWQDRQFKRLSRFVAGFENSERFGWRMWQQACRCGLRQAKEVIYIGDGAGWVRTEHRKHFGRATFIIDWYHASEHIWDCGKELFGQGTQTTKQWVDERLNWLYDGWTKKLLDDLIEQRKKYRGHKREAVDSLYRYISVNEEQMRYDVFREGGYDIGSGAVEGACKNIVGKRLKQSGMIWTRLGSSSVLALRVIWLNDGWQQLWQNKPLAA